MGVVGRVLDWEGVLARGREVVDPGSADWRTP